MSHSLIRKVHEMQSKMNLFCLHLAARALGCKIVSFIVKCLPWTPKAVEMSWVCFRAYQWINDW